MSNVLVNNPGAAGPGRRMRRLAGLVVGGIAVSGFLGCEHGKAQKPQMPARPPAMVTVATATTRDVPVYLDQIGKTLAMQIVSIVPQVGGKLIAAHVQDGALVKKNQLLFEIDPRPFQAALDSAEAMLAQDKAVLALARSELARMEGAIASDAVSKMQYDQKKNAVAIADARIGASEAAVETAKLNLEYTKIYSPIDGRAGALLIHPGNIVKENNAPLLVIEQLDPIYAEFTVTENDLGTVRKSMAAMGVDLTQSPGRGLKVEVEIPGDSARVLSAVQEMAPTTQADPVRTGPREGELTFLDNTVQSQTGTVNLRATLPNSDHYFWPGQFVKCRLVLARLHNAVLIPPQAQQIGQEGPFVYVVRPDDTAEQRPIAPGQPQGDLIVVERGVQAGDKVIVTGQMGVIKNNKVMVVPNVPPASGPATVPQSAPSGMSDTPKGEKQS
jgi:membrane fusion protein, multidrug efflux system